MSRRSLAFLSVVAVVLAAETVSAQPLPAEHCGLEPPEIARRAPRVPRRPAELSPLSWGSIPFARRELEPVFGEHAVGALSGKTVYVSAGHGFVWTDYGWRAQRGNNNGIVEDLVSAEAVDQYLLTYLRNMGARVVPVRESDMNAALVIVDESDATVEGDLTAQSSSEPGWGELPLPITSDEDNPFEAGATAYLTTSATETARAIWAATIPVSAAYNVYVSYAQSGNRASDAHYVVRHAGGESSFRVDQRRHGSTWVFLGRFWFEADAPPEQASVVLSNESADAADGAVVSLDAVRWGGGVGVFDRGGGANGRPMYENCSRYNAQLYGAPSSVFTYASTEQSDDVGTRSRYAAWDHEDGEDAVYLAWHSNAPNPGRGTESYTYGPDPPPGPLAHFSGVAGSLELQAAVHDEIIDDLRAVWDPEWQDRGKFTAYFGEVNPNHNPEMPAVLLEVAFHDTPADADSLRDPSFRRIVSRAMAQGVARYFAARDGAALTLPPEPPRAVRVEGEGLHGLRVSWRPALPDAAGGEPATRYRVYVSRDGHAFDDGTSTSDETLLLEDLPAGATRFVRVAAENAGGESLPSEVVGARLSGAGQPSVLVVGGFDRIDGHMLPLEDLSAYDLGEVERMWLDRINDGSYAARHGTAIADAGFSFDGAADEAVSAGDVDLSRYQATDWFLGEESTGDEPLDAEARAAIAAYLQGGGRLFVTGSELGWAMDWGGTPEEQTFYRETLHALYETDDAETYAVSPLPGPYEGLAELWFDDPAPGAYDAEWPDTLTPGADASSVLEYSGGTGGVAAIAWDLGVVFGFPFETIVGRDVRRDVMARTLAHLEVVEPDPIEPDEDAGPDGDGGSVADAGPDGGGGGGDGGCGCQTAGPVGTGAGAIWLLFVGVVLGRRRAAGRLSGLRGRTRTRCGRSPSRRSDRRRTAPTRRGCRCRGRRRARCSG